MGVKAGRGVRARQRATAAREERLVVKQRRAAAAAGGDRARVLGLIREGRRWMRARRAAERKVHQAEAQTGHALVALVAAGVSLGDAAEAMGLSRSAGRRLVAVAGSTGAGKVMASTGQAAQRPPAGLATEGDGCGPATGDPVVAGGLS